MNQGTYVWDGLEINIITTETHVREITFGDSKYQGEIEKNETPLISVVKTQLDEYFLGQRQQFDLPLELIGTSFQTKVWMELQKIPYGITCSYKDIAERVDCPNGYRAVGGANNKNSIAIVIPCHRVIGAKGNIVGYASGVMHKEKLLALETRYGKQ